MGKIGVEHLCKGCMSFLQYTDRSCPKCGFDEKWFYSGKEYLKLGSILEERYLVGKVLEQNDYELIYIGWDLEANTKVTIRECYLKDLVKRDSTVSGDLILNDPDKKDYYDSFIDNYYDISKKLIDLGNLFGIVWTYDVLRANETSYVITEHFDCVSFDEFMEQRGGRISVFEILSYVQPIIYSLAAVHEAGIVHGNINLKSIVINSNNDVVLTGFGIGNSENTQTTYVDDIQGICKVIYKILCGPRYLNNMTCYNETGKLMMPGSVKDYVVNSLNKGLAPDGLTTYIGIGEMYDDIYGSEEYQIDSQALGFMSNMNAQAQQPITNAPYTDATQQLIGMDMQYLDYDNQYESELPVEAEPDNDNKYVVVNEGFRVVKKNSKLLLIMVATATIMVLIMCKTLIFDSEIGKDNNPSNSQASIGTAIVWKEEKVEKEVRRLLQKLDGSPVYEEELDEITSLTVRSKNVKSLEDLKHFNNLNVLTLNNNEIEDISPIENMTKLTELNLASNAIKDISPLKKLTKLKTLYLTDNKITELIDFSEFKDLSYLDLSENQITNVTNLGSLKSITELSVAKNTGIKDISPLGKLDPTCRLDLEHCGLTDWESVNNILRVNGRPYKLEVEFCYQRNGNDSRTRAYQEWQLHTWRANNKQTDRYVDTIDNFPFPASDTISTIHLSFDMVTDQFGFIIQKISTSSTMDVETNRYIDIEKTIGTVKIQVSVYEGRKNPVVFMDDDKE